MGESDTNDIESPSNDQVQEPKIDGATTTFRSEFYEAYKRQAKVFDKELKEYNNELNVTLLLAALFAVVASAFLTLGEKNDLLLAWDNQQAASTITTIVFCSIAASLIVVVLALFAKRTLKRYAILDFTAADPYHGRYRAPSAFHRLAPRILGLFIEGLSFVLQAALLVVACVLANYLWNQDHHAASLTVAGFEILCIALIASATVGPALLGVSDGPISKNIRRPLLQALVSAKPTVKSFRQRTLPKRRPSALVSDDWGLEKMTITTDMAPPLSPIFDKEPIDWSGCVSDSLCIAWMFDRPIDSDEATVILDFITEVVWHSGICEVPFAKVFEAFDRCFDYSKGSATLIPRLRDRAYKAGKALVHLGVQRKCIGEEISNPFEGFSGTRGPYSLHSYDNDLDSILNIVDRLLGKPQPIDWSEFEFSEPHQLWLSHILLYRAWDHLCYESTLPDDVEAFVTHAFSSMNTDPTDAESTDTDTTDGDSPVIADCLFIISLVIGIPLHVDDLAVSDKSSQVEACYTRIFSKLESTFKGHVVQEYARTLDGIRLVAPLQNAIVASSCYDLFRVILSSSFEEEEIWAAARPAVHGAFKWDPFLPWIGDPDDIIKFLAHHFAIQATGEDDVATQPIEDALRGLAYAISDETLEALKKLDWADRLFVDGIRKAYEEGRPFQTLKAGLYFMKIVQDRWFDDSLEDVMSEEEKGEFCQSWSSAVNEMEATVPVMEAACTTFLVVLKSKKWRSHMPEEMLRRMYWITSLPLDCMPLTACKEDVSILPWLRSRVDEAGEDTEKPKMWKLWLAILWSDYTNLPKKVRDQVLDVTKAVISKSRHDVSFVSCILAGEKEKYKGKLDEYEAVSLEDEPEKLRGKLEGLIESIEKFDEVVGKKAR
ncbi:hypothetical protein BJ322DRAFT_807317 [Thelephora terrestris]|uniref:Uncharacterized protein n=1 Tax=Thelephora terrestris TaxID=56493 RepID=A0A9P6L730_9AGAM|nr:hypothetical protein BJ322DRAFT_807317 [Thelephora terrestris]